MTTTHQPQEILLKVMCSERLPSEEGRYLAQSEYSLRPRTFDGVSFINAQSVPVIAWYEPATRVVLTVEEYERLKERHKQLGYLEAREDMDDEREADELY